jgi:hypothetical protein
LCPGRGAPWSCFRRSSGYRHWYRLWAWASLLAWLERREERPSVDSNGSHRDVLLRSGGLGHGGSPAGRLLVPPSLALLIDPFFSGERFWGIHPSSRTLNRSPCHYPGIRHANLSAAELPAARRGLFARGGGLITGPWAELPFAYAGRSSDPAPDIGPVAGRLVAGSIEPPESDESISLALHLPAAAVGAFSETAISPPPPRAKSGLRPPDWQLGRSRDPLTLAADAASLLFFSAVMSCFSCRKTAGTARLDGPLERPHSPRHSFHSAADNR